MNKFLSAITAVLCCVGVQAEPVYLNCQQMLDVESGRVVNNQLIKTEDGMISWIGSADEFDLSSVNEQIQLRFCLPGLMDMHVHLDHQSRKNRYIDRFVLNPADYALAAANYARITLNAGFTTVRDAGDRYNVTVALRNAINKGIADGPRIFSAAKSLASTGGHADHTTGYSKTIMGDPGPAEGVVNSVDDARKAVRQRYKDGADQIKITATGGVLSLAKNGQNPQFSLDEIQAIVDTAEEYGMHVMAHAHGSEGIRRAVVAGVRSIEHATYLNEELMELMKTRGTFYVPTILAGDFVAEKALDPEYFPAVIRPKALEIGPVIKETFAAAYAAGVKIAFGTDSGVSAHGENAREFSLMVAGGMPELEAIRSATIVAAELLDQPRLGSIKAGNYADIIAVDGNPLEDIALLEHVDFVMKNGHVYKNGH